MMQRNFDVRWCTEGLNVVEAKEPNVRKDQSQSLPYVFGFISNPKDCRTPG